MTKLPRLTTEARHEFLSDALDKFEAMPTRTLAKMLFKQRPELFPSFDACSSAIRYRRGAMGDKHRTASTKGTHSKPRPFGGFADRWNWELPDTMAETWDPFVLQNGKALILSDIHIPFHDPKAIKAIVDEGKRRKPDYIVLNGDVMDFFSCSRFEKNPGKMGIVREVNLGRQFLGWLRNTFPKARVIYKKGNHDEWLDKYIWRKCPELFGLPSLNLKSILTERNEFEPEIGGIEFIKDQQKIEAGHLTILHGHELGKGSIAPPVNPARGAFMKTMECTLIGHLHRTSQHSEASMKQRLISTWSTGCLCGLWPDYAKVNKWDQSAAIVEVYGMDYSVEPLRLHNGELLTKKSYANKTKASKGR